MLSSLELLAPAGDWDCATAAIENGADAIYFGLQAGFNARARATNFSLDDIDRLMTMLHQRRVKGYVTLNTLIFPSELESAEETIRRLAEAGVDAVLVQDVGLAILARAIAPGLPLHASTQMTLTSAETIRLAETLGVERVVLARELSLKEIRKIGRRTAMPLEAFVHGALCVAYSGQCMTSESLGGRSANRGQCAQACRLPYELICDGQDVDLGQQQYLLSPQDLAAYHLIPDLIAAGVRSFKIEGRLKTPEYVANITKHYRAAIDAAAAGKRAEFSRADVQEMELSFSRGFSPGWLGGCDHKMLVPALSSAKRGVLLGTIDSVRGDRVRIELACAVRRGDGIVFDGDRAKGEEQGGRVFGVFRNGRSLDAPADRGVVELTFGHDSLDVARLAPGQKVWKTDDPQLTARLRKTFVGGEPRRRAAIDLTVHAAVGQPLIVTVQNSEQAIRLESADLLVAATRHPLTTETLREQFGRLGGTPYELGQLDARIAGGPMVPLSVMGKLRRELVAAIDARRPAPRETARGPALATLQQQIARQEIAGQAPPPGEPQIHVLCRSLAQLDAVLAIGERSVIVDFQDIRQYRPAVSLAHAAGARILLATPRIQKPNEMGILRVMLRHRADGILARNFAALSYYGQRGVPMVADFSLNATNELSADFFQRAGAERVTASYDLNRDQLLDLVAAVPPRWLEVVVHQHMPMFHMEHCVFCAVLSPGTNRTNCGRPCDRHEVLLRDRVGMEHPLRADVACRNTLYNAVPQSAAEVVPQLLERGVRHFRVELLADAATEEIGRVVRLYRELMAGRLTGKEVWTRLAAANRVGVTRGTLEARRDPLAIL